MKLLYYSTSYHAKHGGSIQSISFFEHLDAVPEVEEKFLFPEETKSKKLKGGDQKPLRRMLKKIPFMQMLFFYRRNLFYLEQLKARIKELEPDVLLMQMDSNFLQIEKLKKEFPEVFIATQINGSPFDEPFKNIFLKGYFRKKQRSSYEKADLNFFISEFSRSSIMGEKIMGQRDLVIHNGTDVSKFFPVPNKKQVRQIFGYPENKLIIGYVGTLDFHKKLQILIDSFNEVSQMVPGLYLTIIGDGPAFSRIKARIEDLGLEQHIELRGWIPHEEINDHLNCFDVAVHHYANHYMNPLKIFEYLSAGLPVIAPDIPSTRFHFVEGKDLLITGPTRVELTKNLKKMVLDEELRSRLSHNEDLIASIEDEYTWAKYTGRIISSIKSKLEN